MSVMILTLDEEKNLPGCLDSVRWCDDVVVLDSYSQDRTASIAQNAGIRLYQRQFDNYANQRNYALSGISYKYPWVLMLDADERVPETLWREMTSAIQSAAPELTLFRMRRRDFLEGRWLRRSSGYPTWFGRLMRVGHVTVARPINEEYRTEGDSRNLSEHLIHFPFNKGFAAWLQKHDRYSSMEAGLLEDRAGRTRVPLGDVFSLDAIRRRRAQKAIVYSLPARPALVFIIFYVLRAGFLDGGPGLTYCLLKSWYEFMIDCKRRELRIDRAALCTPAENSSSHN